METSSNKINEGKRAVNTSDEESNDKIAGKSSEVSSIDKPETSSKSFWKEAEKKVNKNETKILVAECLSILCKVIMSRHVYNFGGKTYLQKEHGCIGDEAIGLIALVVMIWWSKKFKSKLTELDIVNKLTKIYIDDVNGVFKSIKPGTEYKDGKLIFNEEKAKDDWNLPEDKVTMDIVKDIANDIDDMILMTVDIPSNYSDNKVPMLDIKVWINKDDENKIYYSFYEKPTKSPFVVSKTSAMPMSKKIECLG